MHYTIVLEDAPSQLSSVDKHNAIQRFQRILEKSLGGSDNVIASYLSWRYASEADESELSPTDINEAKKWLAAASKAQQEGYRELGESDAYFDIHLHH